MKLQVFWKTVSGLLFCVGLASVGGAGVGSELGCSTSSTPSGSSGGSSGSLPPPTGCTADSTIDCSGGGTGFACDTGDNPESEDTTLSCSTPTSSAGEDDFCCFTWSAGTSTCTPDDDLTSQCPDEDSYGYQCSDASDDPTSLDSSLNCSAGVADGSSTDFCCTLSGSGSSSGSIGVAPTGCTADSTLDCSGGGDGYACDTGDNPEEEDSTLSCSTPTSSAGEDDYCCFTWSAGTSTCTPDDDLTSQCPDADSYGYQCDAADDDPTSLDSSLNCSSGVADPNGTSTDFCCTL